jgi:hypothetical protein
MSGNNLDIKDILENIDGDWLTGILEPYTNDVYDEVMLLNITKEDLSNKNHDNIHQVGYKAPYGDDDEIKGLIYYYFKKCVEWYDNRPGVHLIKPYQSEIVQILPDEGMSLEETAKEEAKLIIDDETNYPENTTLVLLYCEETYIWCLGG